MGWMRWGRRIIERWLRFAVAVAVAVAQFGYNCTCNCNDNSNQSINPAAVKARADR